MKINLETHPEGVHLPLVLSIAKHYFDIFNGYIKGLDFDDLVQIGYMGLMQAWSGWKEDYGSEFASYAGTCIRHLIRNAISTRGDISIPAAVTTQMLKEKRGEQVKPEFQKNVEQAKKIDSLKKRSEKLIRHAKVDFDWRFLDKEELEYAMKSVKDKQKAIPILIMHYGLQGGVPKTTDEIGEVLGISGQRVRQIKSRSLREMYQALQKTEIP